MTAPPFPPGSCDTHVHFYDQRHPTAPSAVLSPPDADVADYRELQRPLGLTRVVVVQPTTYGLDNTCQLDAMAVLGDTARGVMVVHPHTPAAEVGRLTDLGVRGARFHLLPGGALGWDALEATAALVAPFGWHVQLQLDGRDLHQHERRLRDLPVEVVVDHVGRFMPPDGVDHPGFEALVRLLQTGRTWVKLSAPYESTPDGAPDHPAVQDLVDALVAGFADRLFWASNWPHPGQLHPPDADALAQLALRWLPDPGVRSLVLVTNPARFYF